MLALAFLAWLAAAPTESDVLWLAFDVANPDVVGGRRILELDDLLGPNAERDPASAPRPRAVLIVSATLEQCLDEGGFCAAVARAIARAKIERGLLVVVLQGGGDAASRARRALARGVHRFPTVTDTHALGSSVLGIEKPGAAVVLTARREVERFFAPPRRDAMAEYADRLARALLDAVLRGERE